MRRRYTTFTLLLLDVACGVGVFNLAFLLRGVGDAVFLALVPPIAATLIALYLVDGYNPRADLLSVDYASQHLVAFAGATVFVLLFTHAIASGGYALQTSRLVSGLAMLGYATVSLAYRRAIYLRRLRRREARSLLFIGDEASFRSFETECDLNALGLRLHAWDTSTSSGTRPPLTAMLAGITGEGRQLEAVVVREAAAGLSEADSRQLSDLHFSGVPTLTLELFYQEYWRRIPLYRINPTWLFQEGFKVAREPVYVHLKRLSDVVLATLGLLLAAPLIAAAVIAIRIEDGGPAFFGQSRVGLNQRRFRLLKLRTMRTSADVGPLYTQPGDTRITRVGAFLRNSRLDELPQLWNVLRGNMSLIGPRAEWERLVENYEREIPCYHFRHLVKPGITGWAQVNYPYGANLEDTARKLEYDLYYIRHFSFTLDAAIVLKTVHTVLGGKGR
jgi:exopolysaccharide biosynthesis polyprenyl glycosylphosphotransferase